MNIALWVLQILLAVMYFMSGGIKALAYDTARAKMFWVKDVSPGLVRLIGVCEMLGGIGLVFPGALGIEPILTVFAAAGIALIMLFAAIFHSRREENLEVMINVFMMFIAMFIVIGRFVIKPF